MPPLLSAGEAGPLAPLALSRALSPPRDCRASSARRTELRVPSLTWLRRPNATLSRPPPSAGLNTTSLLIVTGAGAVERPLPSMTMPTESIPAAAPPVVVSFVFVWRESDTGLLRGPEGVAAAKRRAGHRTLRVFRDAAVPPIQIARRPHPPYTGVGVGLSKRRG